MARHEHSWGVTSVEGFNCRDSFLTPAMLGVLCNAGADIHDLDITRVLGTTDPTKVEGYIRGVVSTLVEIETATKEGEDVAAKDALAFNERRENTLHILNNGFSILGQEESPVRSATMEIPYTDSKGVQKILMAAAVMGVNGTMSAGLHTDLVSRRNR